MNIYSEIKAMFKMPTPLEVAAAQLATAELELLKSETGVEYASSMVAFNKAQIKRLRAYISTKAVEVTE
jgi:predicted outer membrane protein